MVATFPALLADMLRKDPGRPLVTFYDDATGERVELSVATYSNWVAKTSSLLVEELDLEPGDRVLVDLPTHWLGPVFLGAAWNAGLVVSFPGSIPVDDDVRAVLCGPDGVTTYAELAGRVPVVASALLPLGVRFPTALPEGVHDFGVEVWGQPDSFVPFDPPGPGSEAVHEWGTQAELVAPAAGEVTDLVADGGRLLTTANPASPTGFATFVSPLVRGGSTVWLRNPDPETLERRASDERTTARWMA
ncbi:TIGR03089 family protein [Nocardioides sp. JQ2195]|uniref:TIGR03089 family protein n=1 Tax=Nocardioides sp. JQ2195 TaxID=2592334 RepID=UPI00143E61BD|nr:TIGR03089 family protein [Nocardioides sp. JQ2195]QIX25938.1 TIGR03089 family protein [Nocardioides sp. JQ2195]